MKKKIRIGKKKINKKALIIASVVLLALIILGVILYFVVFKNNSDNTSNTDSSDNTSIINEDQEEVTIVDVNSTSRPYAVMINNIAVARPYQSGLQDAYIIYELIVEGGITRYLALFKDQETARIGSVRSARHYYLDYVMENDAIFVHWGWSDQAQSDIGYYSINNINGLYDSNGFWKDSSLPIASEHTAFTSIEKLDSVTSSKKYRTETNTSLLLNYSASEIDMASIDNAIEASSVSIKYSSSVTSSYKYDSDKGVYYRYVNGEEHTDYVTKEQYYFKNIITYQVNNYTISGDDKGRQELENVGSGTGYYISGGYAIPIKWVKSSRDSQTKYYYESGEELVVNDGNTFIQIQPSGQTLTIE